MDIKDGHGFDYLAITSTHLQLNTKEWKLFVLSVIYYRNCQ